MLLLEELEYVRNDPSLFRDYLGIVMAMRRMVFESRED